MRPGSLAIAVLVIAACGGKHSEWSRLAIVGIDADSALIVQIADDRNSGGTLHQRLVRIDAHGKPQWTRDVTGLVGPIDAHVRVADGIVTVRLQDLERTRNWVEAFHLRDGKPAWTADLGKDEPALYIASLTAAGLDIEISDQGHVVVLDRATGAVRISPMVAEIAHGGRTPEVIGDRLLMTGMVARTAIDLRTGAATGGIGRGAGCMVDGTYVNVLGDDEHGYHVAGIDLSTAAPVWEQPIVLGHYPGGFMADRCGLHGRRVLFTSDYAGVVIGFDLDQRRLAFELALGADRTIVDDNVVLAREPAFAELAGVVTRFAYVRLGHPTGATPEIVTIDVESGTVVHRAEDPSILYGEVLHVGRLHLIQIHSTFTVVDGDSGAVVASRALRDIVLDVRGDQIAGDRLWLNSGRTGLALELATLQPVGKTTVEITDDTVMPHLLTR